MWVGVWLGVTLLVGIGTEIFQCQRRFPHCQAASELYIPSEAALSDPMRRVSLADVVSEHAVAVSDDVYYSEAAMHLSCLICNAAWVCFFLFKQCALQGG